MTPSPYGRRFSSSNAVERCRASSSISTNEPSSKSLAIRSRAVILPFACCFSTARAEAACTASSSRRPSSAILPLVVCRSSWGSTWSSANWLSGEWAVGAVSGWAVTWVTVVLVTDVPTGVERRPLDAAGLARVLPGRVRAEVLDQVASTNTVVAGRAREGAEEGLVVAAEHQTAGQGRLGRVWESPRFAGLTFSVLLRPPVP